MTEPPSFYRREALDYRAEPASPNAVLRVAPPWSRWLFWIVLCLLLLGVGTAFVLRADRTVAGVALIDSNGRSFTAVIPLDDPAAVPAGRRVRLQLVGQDPPSGGVFVGVTKHSESLTSAAAQQAGFGPLQAPAVLVSGALLRHPVPAVSPTKSISPGGLEARAVVVVGSDRIADIIGRGVHRMLSPGGS